MVSFTAYVLTWTVAVLGNRMALAIRCVQCKADRGTCHTGALLSEPCPPHTNYCYSCRVWTAPRSHWGRSYVWRGCSARGPEVEGCQWVRSESGERYLRCMDICDTNDCNSAYFPDSWRTSEIPEARRRRRSLRRLRNLMGAQRVRRDKSLSPKKTFLGIAKRASRLRRHLGV